MPIMLKHLLVGGMAGLGTKLGNKVMQIIFIINGIAQTNSSAI